MWRGVSGGCGLVASMGRMISVGLPISEVCQQAQHALMSPNHLGNHLGHACHVGFRMLGQRSDLRGQFYGIVCDVHLRKCVPTVIPSAGASMMYTSDNWICCLPSRSAVFRAGYLLGIRAH